MCLAKVYVRSGNEKKLLVEEIASLKVKDDRLLMTNLFGEQREIEANIKEIDFIASSIVLDEVKD